MVIEVSLLFEPWFSAVIALAEVLVRLFRFFYLSTFLRRARLRIRVFWKFHCSSSLIPYRFLSPLSRNCRRLLPSPARSSGNLRTFSSGRLPLELISPNTLAFSHKIQNSPIIQFIPFINHLKSSVHDLFLVLWHIIQISFYWFAKYFVNLKNKSVWNHSDIFISVLQPV